MHTLINISPLNILDLFFFNQDPQIIHYNSTINQYSSSSCVSVTPAFVQTPYFVTEWKEAVISV